MAYEREQLHAEINTARVEAGLPAVDVELVLRAGNSAVGHADYVDKFALYCAEIVLDQQSWVRWAS